VALVSDIVRRGQAEGRLDPGLDSDAVGFVLVSAFDGLKILTDVLDPGTDGPAAAALFRSRALTLLAMVEQAMIKD
jgi:TetR/AcrR family transcriptional repressor of nem operon